MSKPTATTASSGTIRNYLRIGQIAERSGVSAKALRLYEQRGLLKPCAHSQAGYRLYGQDALQRLMQIVLLKRSGFALAEIGVLLKRDAQAATRLLDQRIAVLERDLAARSRTLQTLRNLAQQAGSASTLNVDQLLESIIMTNTLDLHFTEVEREGFRQRAEKLGESGMADAQRAWPELIAQVRAAMDGGTAATDPAVVDMGRRWHALVVAATGNDAAINQKLSAAYVVQPDAMAAQGMDMEMFRYMGAAMAAAGLSLQL
jgi:DNA-binding transcriptional MerR regulator